MSPMEARSGHTYATNDVYMSRVQALERRMSELERWRWDQYWKETRRRTWAAFILAEVVLCGIVVVEVILLR